MEENNFNQNLDNTSDDQYTPQEPVKEIGEKIHKPIGPVVGLAIIIIIIIFGGLYYWGTQLNRDVLTAEEIVNQADPTLENLQAQSNSDEISAIEKDLNATELDNIDQELEQIDAEFNF
jgi:uncharacterized protein HemX